MTDTEYDEMVKALAAEPERTWVKARDVESALAFQQWCVDNGLEAPQVRIVSGT